MNSITLRRLVIFGGLGCFLAATALIVYVSVRWSPETEHISGNVATPSSDTEVSADSQNLGTDKVSNSSTQLWLIIVTLVACLTALIAVIVAFYLYRWRRILLAEHQNLLVPEKWGAELRGNRDATQQLISSYNQNTNLLSDFLEHHSEAIRQMTETFMTFKKSLDDKDAEIERLRQGYDAHVYRQFLNRFIRVHQSLVEQAADEEVLPSNVRTLTLLLEDALEESGVAPFEPEPGEDIRELGDRIADSPKVLETPDPDNHLKIAEVNSPGYELISGEKSVVLIPAQVTVYRISNLGEEG
mgnify:CR=1 FL=1|jgi:hypothetical protein